jgi:hypothetical protein
MIVQSYLPRACDFCNECAYIVPNMLKERFYESAHYGYGRDCYV